MNAVGKFQSQKRVGRRNMSQAADMIRDQAKDETEFIGHKPTETEMGILRNVIAEWEAHKDKKVATARDQLPSFTDFAGPELMSLYMDKARAAMLSERDVREQSDRVVEHLIKRHMDFRNADLEWADRQTSFNDLLAHAENYLQQTEPGRVEDRVNMGEAVTRPVEDSPGPHWGSLETLPRPKPAVVLSPEITSKYMYKHVANQVQGEYKGTMNIDSEDAEADLQFNMLGHTLAVNTGVADPVTVSRPGIEKITISGATEQEGRKLVLPGTLDDNGVITGTAHYVSSTGVLTPIGSFSITPAFEGKARECGPRKFQVSPDRFCCPAELLKADRFFVTRPQGSCDCWCGKLP
jgi:hypothetical protein